MESGLPWGITLSRESPLPTIDLEENIPYETCFHLGNKHVTYVYLLGFLYLGF
jgi:urease accessory protein UreE